MKRGIIMDELNMDSLDLPEMEHDYSDVLWRRGGPF